MDLKIAHDFVAESSRYKYVALEIEQGNAELPEFHFWVQFYKTR